MHESEAKEGTEIHSPKQKNAKRPYKYYVLVTHRQLDFNGQVAPTEFLSFEDKSALRTALDNAAYESAELRIIRGYEMNVKSKRQISLN